MNGWVGGEVQPEATRWYDFAVQRESDVLRSIGVHLRRCLSHGRGASVSSSGKGNRQRNPMACDVIGMLDSHFRCLNEEVTCSRARPFFPALLGPSRLRIPTPVTVHLDQCPQCAEDFRVLREFDLGMEQLQKLHWLYGSESAGDLISCRQARSGIVAFVRGTPERIDGGTLEHLGVCPRCRAEVYLRRQALLEKTGPADDSCNVTADDLFDYVISFDDVVPRAGRPQPAHVTGCRKCLETIQAMHRAIFGVVERPESGVATIYSTLGDAEVAKASPDDPYAGYAVGVRTIRREPQAALARVAAVPRRIAFNPHTRWLLKAAVAAAAVIPLAILFSYTHSASGITLGEVVKAFGRANNVHVTQINPVDGQVTYELWISRPMNIAGVAARGKATLVYDLAGRRKGNLDTGAIDPIDDQEYAYANGMVDSGLGFTLADVPPSASWDRVKSDGAHELYELTWMGRTRNGRPVAVRYEIMVDLSTKLPVSLRIFLKDSEKTGWEHHSSMVFTYPTDGEMESALMGESPTGPQMRR